MIRSQLILQQSRSRKWALVCKSHTTNLSHQLASFHVRGPRIVRKLVWSKATKQWMLWRWLWILQTKLSRELNLLKKRLNGCNTACKEDEMWKCLTTKLWTHLSIIPSIPSLACLRAALWIRTHWTFIQAALCHRGSLWSWNQVGYHCKTHIRYSIL